jgi:hypothetical protein
MRLDGGRITLTSRIDKGWTQRTEKTNISAEFPGTAVLWDEQYYEVVFTEKLPQGVRYGLEPWKESNTMRVVDQYDEATEAHRLEEHRKKLLREKQRKSANVLAIFVGHLPAHVQEAMANELGLMAPRITAISVFAMFLVVGGLVLFVVRQIFASEGIPLLVVLAGVYIAVESIIRGHIALMQARPMGSVVGWIAYAIFHAITKKGPSPFAVSKGLSTPITDAPPDVAQQDALIMREGFFTLLPAADQQRIAARFGYDYRRESPKVARIILVSAIVGVISFRTTGALISLIAAAALGVEQVFRFIAFRRGPAGSILGFLVRPFVRKYL